MNIELFAAAVFFAIGSSAVTYYLLTNRIKSMSTRDDRNLTSLESRLNDMITELNHVANSHVHAVEDRRDELRRVLEVANDRTRRINTLLSDLEILEKRIRQNSGLSSIDSTEEKNEGAVEDIRRRPADSIVKALDSASTAEPVRVRRQPVDEVVDLLEDGHSPEEIAMKLKMPQNAVEMIVRRCQS